MQAPVCLHPDSCLPHLPHLPHLPQLPHLRSPAAPQPRARKSQVGVRCPS
jgi:hypothetical protein